MSVDALRPFEADVPFRKLLGQIVRLGARA